MAVTFGTVVTGTLKKTCVATKSGASGMEGAYTHALGVLPALVTIHGLTGTEIAWRINKVTSTVVEVQAPTSAAGTALLTMFKSIHSLIG